ncbi:MAG: hypothetical protein JKY71_09690 [Alphaproteobacteria bacterium]|nr:hypothetical protein [Alphaproteobacteria bacterium]
MSFPYKRFILLSSAMILAASSVPTASWAQDSDVDELINNKKRIYMGDVEDIKDLEDEDRPIGSNRLPTAFDDNDDPDGLEDIQDLDPELTKEYREEIKDDDEEEGVHDRNNRRREEMEIRRELRKQRREEELYSVDPY